MKTVEPCSCSQRQHASICTPLHMPGMHPARKGERYRHGNAVYNASSHAHALRGTASYRRRTSSSWQPIRHGRMYAAEPTALTAVRGTGAERGSTRTWIRCL